MIELIKALREKTQAGVLDCKNALEEAGGDINKAILVLREKGKISFSKLSGRNAKDGGIFSYIHHNGKCGVLLELNCETDFVAKTEEFKNLGKELCLQIAASSPLYISKDDVPKEKIEEEKDIIRRQFEEKRKPENVLNRIVEGGLLKFYEENCLLEQKWIRDEKVKVIDILLNTQNKLKEKIFISRFVIFKV